MTRSVPQLYLMNESEYKLFRGFFRIGYIASLTAALTGLAGIVAGTALTRFAGPENSQLAKEIMNFSIPVLFGGTVFSLYSGLNYHANLPLDKVNKKK